MKEYQPGEVTEFVIDGVIRKLQIKKQKIKRGCKDCFFYNPSLSPTANLPCGEVKCFSFLRTDGKNILFVECKENKKELIADLVVASIIAVAVATVSFVFYLMA